MVDSNALNTLIEDYLDKVDNHIVAYGMNSKRGTDVLDRVQEEVNSTTDRLRMNAPSSTISSLRLDANRSVERVEAILCQLTSQKLGALPESRSISDNTTWGIAMSQVTVSIAAVTDRFSKLLINMDDNRRNQYDTNFSNIVEQGNAQMQKDNSDASADGYSKWAMTEIKKIEKNLTSLQNQSTAEILQVLLQEKDAERLSLISQAKSIESGMSKANKGVINMHNKKAMEILQEMAPNPTTYDGTVRDRKFRLIDKHLANIQRIVQTNAFTASLDGGMFTSPKNLSVIHKRGKEHQTNFISNHKYIQKRPPRTMRAGRLGEAPNNDDEEMGLFEISPGELGRPFSERLFNTSLITVGIVGAGWLYFNKKDRKK